jgi:hypothetical protein
LHGSKLQESRKTLAARPRPGVQEQDQDYYGLDLGLGLAFAHHYSVEDAKYFQSYLLCLALEIGMDLFKETSLSQFRQDFRTSDRAHQGTVNLLAVEIELISART